MSEMTREEIEKLRDMLKARVAMQDAALRTYEAEWAGIDKLCDLALTARSEGFREGVEAAADICQSFAEMSRLYEPQPKTGRLTAEWCEGRIRALSPRETDEGYANAHPRELDAPASAPSGEVAEMVKRLRECLSEHNRIRIAFLHNLERSVKPLEYETERQAFEALNNAAALLSKVVQGWVPVSERLPTMQGDYLWVLETGRVRSETFFPKMASGITATHWMPLPPPPERP